MLGYVKQIHGTGKLSSTMHRRNFIAATSQLLLLGATSGLTFAQQKASVIRFVGAEESPPFSYNTADGPAGFVVDMLKACHEIEPSIDFDIKLYPWTRAQWMVSNQVADAFCTFPSEERQEYALFTEQSLFDWSFGNLVYHRDNPNAKRLAEASSWEDLRGLTFIGQYNTGWEDDNIPDFLNKQNYNSQEQMLQILLRRRVGDFLVMSPIEATYLIEKFNLKDRARQTRVNFIENADVPFHIGISKAASNAAAHIARYDARIASKAYKTKRREIEALYSDFE